MLLSLLYKISKIFFTIRNSDATNAIILKIILFSIFFFIFIERDIQTIYNNFITNFKYENNYLVFDQKKNANSNEKNKTKKNDFNKNIKVQIQNLNDNIQKTHKKRITQKHKNFPKKSNIEIIYENDDYKKNYNKIFFHDYQSIEN